MPLYFLSIQSSLPLQKIYESKSVATKGTTAQVIDLCDDSDGRNSDDDFAPAPKVKRRHIEAANAHIATKTTSTTVAIAKKPSDSTLTKQPPQSVHISDEYDAQWEGVLDGFDGICAFYVCCFSLFCMAVFI